MPNELKLYKYRILCMAVAWCILNAIVYFLMCLSHHGKLLIEKDRKALQLLLIDFGGNSGADYCDAPPQLILMSSVMAFASVPAYTSLIGCTYGFQLNQRLYEEGDKDKILQPVVALKLLFTILILSTVLAKLILPYLKYLVKPKRVFYVSLILLYISLVTHATNFHNQIWPIQIFSGIAYACTSALCP